MILRVFLLATRQVITLTQKSVTHVICSRSGNKVHVEIHEQSKNHEPHYINSQSMGIRVTIYTLTCGLPRGRSRGGGGGGGSGGIFFKRGGGGGPTTYRYSGAICIEIFSKKGGYPWTPPPPPPPPPQLDVPLLPSVSGGCNWQCIGGPDEQELLLSAWNITSAQYTHSELVLTKNSTVMKGKDVLCSKQNRTRDEQEVSVTKYSAYLKFGDMLESARNS